MIKNCFLLVFTFLAISLYAQKSTLLQNTNFRAKELKHHLNESGDSLVLNSNKTIYSVEIFNQDYSKTVKVDSSETKISITDTPLGRLVVEAKLVNKRILMTLLRHEDYNKISNDSILTKNEIVDTPEPKDKGISSMLNWKSKKDVSNVQKFYWAVQESNDGNRSYKSMKLVNIDELLKMIQKNKAEVKTPRGKFNKLTVWEVYDTVKFMEQQVANPDYIFSASSALFNTKPYFSSIGNAR